MCPLIDADLQEKEHDQRNITHNGDYRRFLYVFFPSGHFYALVSPPLSDYYRFARS